MEYKARLDDKILYLLRLKAMQERIVERREDLTTHDSLYDYLMNNNDYLQNENGEYFKRLAFEIGVDEEKERRRGTVKKEKAWETVVYQIKKILGVRYENLNTVKLGDVELNRDEAREDMAKIFGFENYEDMDVAVHDDDYKYVSKEQLTVENQDLITAVLGYKSWADVNGESDAAYKIGVNTLKRLYGKLISNSKASTNTRDAIAMFICGKKWDEMAKDVDTITKDIEKRILLGDSSRMDVLPNAVARPNDIYSSQLYIGDNVRIIFKNDSKMILEYQGDYYYKVLESQSKHLKVEYQFVLTELHIGIPFCTDRIQGEDGYDLGSIYTSKEIKSLAIKRGPNAPKSQDAWTGLNGHNSSSCKNSHTFAEKSKTGMNMKEMKKKLCVMGAGPLTFDVIMKREYPEGFVPGKRNKFEDRVMIQELGSNTGNVMCILGYFGWDSYPIALLDDYPQGLQMKKDFERYHCNTRFVTNTRKGGSNIFTITHKLDNDGNLIKSRAKRHAPFSGFPRDKALTIDGKNATLPKFLEALDFLPDVYFFSNGGAGWRELGKYMRSKGVLVYYELQSMSGKELGAVLKCMKEADIVKFSDETVEDASFVDELKDKLVIQTLGEKGARFNLCGKGWVTLPPVLNENVVDTEGCGDWTTASFINALGKRGVQKLEDMTEAVVKECLEEAQQYASRNVSYMGTKGIIPTDMKFNLEPSTYEDPYEKEMDGRKGIKKTKIEKLEAVPETELMIYDAKDCLIYRSDYECLNGIERTFGKKECSVMSNFYPCKLPYIYNGEKVVFNSAEQAYHFFRYKEFPLIQDMVLRQKSGKDTMSACSGFKYVDSDHEQTRWMYMTLVEELKYLHCKEFREKILSLDDTILVESSGDTDIFGSTIPGSASKAVKFAKKKGLNLEGRYIGMNGCGRCIMAVRDKFRGWTDAQLKDYTPNPDIFMWWEESLEYKKQLTGMLF